MLFPATAYINGKIYTMENEGETCSAFVVRDGKFIYCGSDEEAMKLADEVIDLKGSPVLPGFIDTHQHLYAYARNLTKMDLSGATSLAEMKDMLREFVKDIPEGDWVLGVGFDNERFTDNKEIPTRWDLDEVCPDHPMLLSRYCLHFFTMNSMALEMNGIGKGFEPKVPGTVRFDKDGLPTGVVADATAADILAKLPDPLDSFDAKLDILEKACRLLNSHGLTGVHPIRAMHCDLMEYMDLYQTLNRQGRLSIRTYVSFDELPNNHFITGLGDDMVKYGFYKMYLDGNLGGRTAAMLEPYSDDPSATGAPNYTQEQVTEMVRKAHSMNLQVGAHCIGDRAVEMLTTAFEAAYAEDPRPDTRFRMIHAAVVTEDQLDRFKKLPLILDVQPLFIPTDMPWVEDRVGEERGNYVYCWKKMYDRGLMMTSGTDNPCGSYDPFEGIYACVTRCDMDGKEAFHPEEAIPLYEAVRMLTWNAAYSSYEEDIKGSIREGKLADFIITDRDIFEIDPMEIKDTKVLKTYLGGRLVYERPEA